ncbi:hypothetical protein AGMMS49938_18370 [Fibrobacterales bacterium]|nr:hypothetical protein AGMMS49938_18370 [Fibrobacterales bacterium]
MKIKNSDTPPPLDSDEAEKLKGRRRFWALIIIILLLLLFFLIFQWKVSQTRAAREAEARQQQFALAIEKAQEKAKFILDSIKAADSVGEVSPSFQNCPDSSRAGLTVVGAGLKPAPVTVKPAPTNTAGGFSATPSPKGGTPLTTPAPPPTITILQGRV